MKQESRIWVIAGLVLAAVALAVLVTIERPRPDLLGLEPVAPVRLDPVAPEGIPAIVARVSPGVVELGAGRAAGSGFLIDHAGHVLTNAHVIKDRRAMWVRFAGGAERLGRVVGVDRGFDLALLRVADLPPDARPLRLGRSNVLRVGELVVAIGSPFGLGGTVTAGIVSALDRTISGPDGYSIPGAIQTDAPINPGNSGGPLLDRAGRVVGINTKIIESNIEGNIGIGFAVPVDIARRALSYLMRGRARAYPWLGMSGRSVGARLARERKLPVERGVLVARVSAGSPVAQAGIQAGAIILAIDDVRIDDLTGLHTALLPRRPGERVRVRLVGPGGTSAERVITLGERPDG